MSLLVTIVGRPNVGKSTLFNRIVGEPKALVHDAPGVTRDRLYASSRFRVGDNMVDFTLVDTGGLEQGNEESLNSYVGRQVQIAIEESDVIIAVVDGRAGLLPDDSDFIQKLRKVGKDIVLCVNKIDINMHEDLMGPFYQLGLEHCFGVSAQHNRGIEEMLTHVLRSAAFSSARPFSLEEDIDDETVKLAIIGRPNVGKSRLLNYLCGEERSVVSEVAGTTRDPINTKIEYKGKSYMLVDTAGIRRQAKIDETLEYLSVLRSLRAVGLCDIAILVVDATEGVTHQELRLASQIWNKGRGLICFYNKCDLIDGPVPKGLKHYPHVATCAGAAIEGVGMEPLMKLTESVIQSYRKRVKTAKLNDIVNRITRENPPPNPKGRPLKIRYATQIRHSPPHFQIFVNRLSRLPENYKKYLSNSLHKYLKTTGVPIRIDFKESE